MRIFNLCEWFAAILVVLLSTELNSLAGSDETREENLRILDVVLFYSPGCQGCEDVKSQAIPKVQREFGAAIRVCMHNTDELAGFKLLLEYENRYKTDDKEPLKVFVGRRYLAGRESILGGLSAVVQEELAGGAVTYVVTGTNEVPGATTEPGVPVVVAERFLALTSMAVMGAGLIDGINPCAFTTLVFFLSLLGCMGRSGKDLLIVGSGFSAAVFGTYVVLGLAAMKAIKAFSVGHGLSRGITWVTALAAFGLALWSFRDFVAYRRSGRSGDMTLGLPHAVVNRIHAVMRSRMTTGNLLAGSVVTGVLVSLLESACTGQVYLPTIVFMLRDATLKNQALSYLLLYNVMFIAPLLVVFGLAYSGVRSQALAGFARRHVGSMKIVMAILFGALGLLLLTTL